MWNILFRHESNQSPGCLVNRSMSIMKTDFDINLIILIIRWIVYYFKF